MTVALTGGIGSGKTTVSGYFAELGVPVIDADEISHRVTNTSGPAYQAVKSLLGDECFDERGNLRREFVRKQVFADPALRGRLESIIHPIVKGEIDRQVADIHSPYCIVSVPLLVETGMSDQFDCVLVLDVPERLQLERTMDRDGVAAADVARIIRSQADPAQRRAVAGHVLRNDSGLDSLRTRVRELHEMYLAAAETVASRE